MNKQDIRSCVCGRWKINATVYPTPPEGLVDPCPNCGISQYAYRCGDWLEPAPMPGRYVSYLGGYN